MVKIETTLDAVQIQRLFRVMQDTEIPYEARVRKAAHGKRTVLISCSEDNAQHWHKVLEKIGGTANE